MELKHYTMWRKRKSANVLIVPYGIETFVFTRCRFILNVLIVPYGIETEKDRPDGG